MTSKIPEDAFSVVSVHGIITVKIPPRLSILEAVAFTTTCQGLVQQEPPPQKIQLDCGDTHFIDSSGVGALVKVLKTCREQSVVLSLQGVHPSVNTVLEMTGLHEVLTIDSYLEHPVEASKQRVVNRPPETHPSVRSPIKRLIDIVGSLVGLGITAVLFIPIAIAIKRDSPGPIFFGQVRCGWLGRRFRIWKFRSMCSDAEAMKNRVKNEASGAFFKNENDFRVTKVGRFLRRTSLDELPQFWNVLRGEMSLVGTRPPTPDEVERYQVPEWQRLDVKPGMTGEWQVNGRSKIRNFEDVIQLDLRYQSNWSLIYDIQLILKTILILFRKNSGAV
ncbi:sugar transferase [Spirulina subsalsa FACHB-351]|uniref:Sugar transferase n=1 Tax=Spirulina subsalsa FACHB-351 TaxID=234711 RepID=A0ABT3L8T1_9CYAN|nr:sugar transferase [Spirulina subsalsa]MCW6037862.1 sugar transferase [Spirulina subsalsa FACHB-351]